MEEVKILKKIVKVVLKTFPITRVAYNVVSTTLTVGRYVQPKLLKYIHQPYQLHPGSNLGQSQSQSQDSFNHSNVVDWYVEN